MTFWFTHIVSVIKLLSITFKTTYSEFDPEAGTVQTTFLLVQKGPRETLTAGALESDWQAAGAKRDMLLHVSSPCLF